MSYAITHLARLSQAELAESPEVYLLRCRWVCTLCARVRRLGPIITKATSLGPLIAMRNDIAGVEDVVQNCAVDSVRSYCSSGESCEVGRPTRLYCVCLPAKRYARVLLTGMKVEFDCCRSDFYEAGVSI